jgi:FAD/FMN-containing dehydrogenase
VVADRLLGKLIWRDLPNYEEARVKRVFNGRQPQRFPSAVLFADSIDDVITGVQLARENHLTVAVRSGGHSWDGWSVRDGSLLIDLGRMRETSYDERRGIATVSPSITGGELNPFLAQFGLFFPGGHCPDVGLGGFLLQGGMGWNTRGWGWTCERIAAIDVVTADGTLVHANERENADLFWAARGSGPGFFAIVVRFYLRVRPQPKALTRSTFVYPMRTYDEVMHWLHGIHKSLDSSVELVAIGLQTPVPGKTEAGFQHSLVVHALSFADTEEEAHAALAPLESCPAMAQAMVRDIKLPTTLQKEYEEQRRQNPRGNRYAADNLWLSGSAQEVVPLLKPCFESLPTTRTFALWYSMAPLLPLSDMALSLQAEIYFAVYTVWTDPADDARCRRWLCDQMQRMERRSDGFYLGDSDLPTRSGKFTADGSFQKLQHLRKKYDPAGRFCSYQPHAEHALNTNPWETKATR